MLVAGNASTFNVSKRCKKSALPLVALTRGDSQILEIPLICSNTLIHNPWDAPRAVANNSDPQWSSDNEWGTLGEVFCAVDEVVSQEFSVAENLLLGPNGESGCMCTVRGSWFFYNSFIVAVRILGILTCFRSQPQMSTFSSSHDETLSLQTFSGQNPGWFS